MICYKDRGWLKTEDMLRWSNAIERCSGPWPPSPGRSFTGVLIRSPGWPDQEGPDDYIAVTSACKVLRMTRIPSLILNHGKQTGWVYDNTKDGSGGWSSRFWRQPQVLAHFHHSLGLNDLPWREAVWLGCATLWKPDDPQSCILNWFMHRARTSPFFEGKLYSNYPGTGMRGAWSDYFKNGEHPLARYGTT